MAAPSALTSRPAILTVVNPSGQRRRIVLGNGVFHAGRQPDNQLVLRDNRVSRVHLRITNEGTDYFVEDLNSRHGLFVNNQKIESRHRLEHGETVSFGLPDGYQIIFHREEDGVAQLADLVQERSKTGSGGGNLSKLRALVEVARALQGSFSINQVLDSVVDAALTVTGCERGFMLLNEASGLEVKVARDADGSVLSKDDLRVPRTLIQRALDQRRELLAMNFDPLGDQPSNPDHSVARLELRSVICVPIVRVRSAQGDETMVAIRNETAGVLYLDSRTDLADLTAGNRELLQTLALEASTILENARLLEDERIRQRLEEELRIARDIQRGLLPRELPTAGWLRVAASSVPSFHVGGDYYDVTPLVDGGYALVVADVSGKGVSSALLASLLQGAFLLASNDKALIGAMLSRINLYLYERTGGEKYATLFYAAISPDGTMHWANAGHCKPFLLRGNGAVETLPPTSMPVGMLPIAQYEAETMTLIPGDKLIVYSDGVSEAQNFAGEYFETGRMVETLLASLNLSSSELHDVLQRTLTQFTGGAPQRDDMTLLVAEFQPGEKV
jgi:serine phosphatase RsbU (regulator of sigma subunit)